MHIKIKIEKTTHPSSNIIPKKKKSPPKTDQSTEKKATPGRIRIFRARKITQGEERHAKLEHALNNPISPILERARFPALVSRGSRQRAAEWFVGHVSTHFYLFLYLFRADPRATHTHTKPRGKRLQGWDSAFARRRGAARNLSGFRAFMGPLLGQLEDIVYFVSMMIQIVEFLFMFLFFLFFGFG